MAEDTVTVGGEGGQSGNGVESRLVGLGPRSYRYGWGLCPRLWRASPHAVPPHPHSEAVSAVRSPHHLTALRDGKAPICSGPRF